MKINHGNVIIILFLLLTSFLQADDFEYNISIDNKQPFVKEAVLIKINFKQINPNIVLMFNFDLVKRDDYYFKRVHATESDINHNTKASYTYLVYPLKSNEVNIEFKLTKRVTTDESVAYSFSGDRDNVKGLITTDTKIKLNPVKLLVKKLPQNTTLVGDFKLDYTLKNKQVLAYEPIAMKVNIKGIGYPPSFKKFPLHDGDFTLFRDTPITTSRIINNSISTNTTYPMAISGSKSFNTQKVSIKVFNPKTKSSYFLQIPALKFDVKKVEIKELVDNIDSPKPKENNFKDFLYFIVIFITGFLSGYFFRNKNKQIKSIKEKIYNCKTKKYLHNLVLLQKNDKYKKMINECEKSLYKTKRFYLIR